ncbi:hypothetical protein [Pseudonocardia sp. WMMC193]|uniref:hypothetical protein n=1 Tax=Pseudonocardia sp. WMMC193 TaxID=2911965 RepID=UPI001F2E0508|nr:hypothetical protein [Pseudonocardia sp. WMMC193]MCF7547538.1 hypothetical protein [Pseudonocardia sp. WMMC193]
MLNPDRTHRREGSHWVSPVNFDPEVQAAYTWPEPFALIDSTLRKTLFTAGAVTSMAGFARIAEALAEAGVREECLNINWGGGSAPIPRELELVRTVAGGDHGMAVTVYADTLLSDGEHRQPVTARETVELLAGLGVRRFSPGIVPAPSADAQKRQTEELAALFALFAEVGAEATITFAHAGRRDFDTLVEMSNEAIRLGATRMDLMDSTSSLGPDAMRVFVRRYRAALLADVPVTMHVHDDFGLATAGAVAAATAGASPDVSVAGMSYRAGFAPLEEVVTSLEVLYGVDTGIRTELLTGLAELVAQESGVAVPPLKPLVGEYAFLKHMPGDVLGCLRGGVDQFPPVSGCVAPDLVGGRIRWVWDSLSTDAMAAALAAAIGEETTPEEARAVRLALDAAVAAIPEYPRLLVAEQAERICLDTLAAARA